MNLMGATHTQLWSGQLTGNGSDFLKSPPRGTRRTDLWGDNNGGGGFNNKEMEGERENTTI